MMCRNILSSLAPVHSIHGVVQPTQDALSEEIETMICYDSQPRCPTGKGITCMSDQHVIGDSQTFLGTDLLRNKNGQNREIS